MASSSSSAAASASVTGAASGVPADPPARAAGASWVVNVVDHTITYQLAPMADGGVVVMGQSEAFLGARDDMFVTRLDPDGATVWQHLGVGRFVRAIRSTMDSLYLLTEFSGNVRFNGISVDGGGNTSLMVARLSASGEARWGKLFDSPDYDRAGALVPLPDGGVVMAHGAFRAPSKGAVQFRVAGGQDTLLSRWSPSGDLTWVKSLEWPGYDKPSGIVPSKGELIAAGTRWKKSETDADALANNACQGWIARVKMDGEVAWLKPLGEPERHTEISAVAEGPDGAVTLAGTFQGKTTLGGVTLDPAKGKGFLARLDADGVVAWAHPIPTPTCLAVSPSGQAYVGTKNEVLRVSWAGEQVKIFHIENKDGFRLQDCALAGSNRLFISGEAPPDASIGDKKIGPPRTNRSPKWLSTYSVAFVARLDL